MVKFALASVFLILTYLFALVSAAPLAPLFRISSLRTSRLIFSDGSERVGERVITVPTNQANDHNSLVTIDPPFALGGAEGSMSTVKGKAGLYIAIQIDGDGGYYLVWRKEEDPWYFLLQPSEAYYTVAVPDQDYYWYGNSSTNGLDVKFEAGGMQTREVFFRVKPVYPSS